MIGNPRAMSTTRRPRSDRSSRDGRTAAIATTDGTMTRSGARATRRARQPSVDPPPRLGPPADQLTERSRSLLDGLEAIVVVEGFARFTLADLARELKCSLRAFYTIAPNRRELLLIVVDRRMRRLGRRVREELAEHEDPLERLRVVLTLETTALQSTSAQFRRDAQALPGMTELILGHKRHGASLIRDILVDGMRRNRFRPLDPDTVVEFIDAAVTRLEEPRFADDDDLRWSDHVDELSRFVEAGVLLHVRPPGAPNDRPTDDSSTVHP